MKKLMLLLLPSGEGASETSFLPEELQSKDSCDWRDEIKKNAPTMGWRLEDSDLETVRSMMEFLIRNEDWCKNFICRVDAHLPGQAVLVDDIIEDAPYPLFIIWEEDIE